MTVYKKHIYITIFFFKLLKKLVYLYTDNSPAHKHDKGDDIARRNDTLNANFDMNFGLKALVFRVMLYLRC